MGQLTAEARLVYMNVSGETQVVMYPIYQYIWANGRVVAQLDKLYNETYYYFYNGHGDVVQITDTDGNVENTYDYDVWGNFLKKDETVHNPFTYFCQTYDDSTGLYYLRARYYDPTIGRFTQQDPAEDGYKWYVYGNNNPVIWIDPSGESVNVYGITASVGLGFAGYEGMYLWATDDKGNFALLAVNGYSTSMGASLSGIWIWFPDMLDITSLCGLSAFLYFDNNGEALDRIQSGTGKPKKVYMS